MLRAQLRGWGGMNSQAEAENFCRNNTNSSNTAEVQGCGSIIMSGENPFDYGWKEKAGGSMPTTPGVPAPSQGGFIMPALNPFAPTLMPGMPGYIAPGMPGYVAPTPWYSNPMMLLVVAGVGLLAYKVLAK